MDETRHINITNHIKAMANSNRTTIEDIDIPFFRLVLIILKFMIASIPALIVFYILVFLVIAVFFALFGGGLAVLQTLVEHSMKH